MFCNEKYVSNVRKTNKVLKIGTNVGPMISNMICNLTLLGTVWYNENSISNMISLSDMKRRCKVTMDSSKDKALLIYLPDKIVCFQEMSNGLYALDPNNK
jgi:hypothetical protein